MNKESVCQIVGEQEKEEAVLAGYKADLKEKIGEIEELLEKARLRINKGTFSIEDAQAVKQATELAKIAAQLLYYKKLREFA